MQIIILQEIANRLKISTRHAARLALENDWKKSGDGYDIMSIAMSHMEILKTPETPARGSLTATRSRGDGTTIPVAPPATLDLQAVGADGDRLQDAPVRPRPGSTFPLTPALSPVGAREKNFLPPAVLAPRDWANSPESSKEEASRRFRCIEIARELKKRAVRGYIQEVERQAEIICGEKVSYGTVNRWLNLADKAIKSARRDKANHQEYQLSALLPAWGATKGRSLAWEDPPGTPGPALAFAARMYLNQSRLNLSFVYWKVKQEAAIHGWRTGSLSSLSDAIDLYFSPSTQIAARMGYPKWKADCGLKIYRDYTEIQPNFMWVGDHHIFDVMVNFQGKQQRPWITTWHDMNSRSLMGWCISFGPNSKTIVYALRHAILPKQRPDFPQCGVPVSVYVDNGKDYRCQDLKGREIEIGKIPYPEIISRYADLGIDLWDIELEYDEKERAYVRKRGKENIVVKKIKVGGVFARLGVRPHYATAYHPWTKPIERNFKNVVQNFSRGLPGWCGSNPQEKPDKLNWEIKSGRLLNLPQFVAQWEDYVISDYHNKPHSGHGMNGRTPMEAWKTILDMKNIFQPEMPALMHLSTEYLDFAMMKQTQVKVNNSGGFQLNGEPFELIIPEGYQGAIVLDELIKRRVDILYNFEMTDIRVFYDARFVCAARSLRRASMICQDNPVMVEKIKLQHEQEKHMRGRLELIHGKGGAMISASEITADIPLTPALSPVGERGQLPSPATGELGDGIHPGLIAPPPVDTTASAPVVIYLTDRDRYQSLWRKKIANEQLDAADNSFMSEYETTQEYQFSSAMYQTELEFYQSKRGGKQ